MQKGTLFNSIQLQKPRTNRFDLTHDVKLSAKMGDLVPIMVTECVPGDKFTIGAEALVRFAPLLAPVMHRVDISMHYFFVPNRIIWADWELFITQTVKPGIGVVPVLPYFNIGTTAVVVTAGNLCDYMGLPLTTGFVNVEKVSALPLLAYQKVYNDYYRDQNLITDLFQATTLGNPANDMTATGAAAGLFTIRKRAWEHDYFTSSLPFAQKGAPVAIPLGDVVLKAQGAPGANQQPKVWKQTNYATPSAAGAPNINLGSLLDSTAASVTYDPQGSLTVGATTINDLRRAFRLQEWLERNARGGTRYIENVLAHFGVKSSDQRLNRPEYITGVKSPLVISEVLNTTGSASAPVQGNMSGHGVGVVNGKHGTYYCEEHGYIIGILSIMPRTAYQQGVPRHYTKTTDAFEYFWPEFANIGEQAVFNREIYAGQATALQTGTFGYVPRYAEYKFENNRVAGEFRTTLAFWHFGRIFTSAPALNQVFIECTPRTDPFAVTDPDNEYVWCQILNKVTAIRPMPQFGTPQF